MDCLQASARSKKNSPLILSVLYSPPKSQLKQICSPSSEFFLFQYTQKKMTLAAYDIQIQKSKLLTNLEIYQWRCQTEFPIVKTIFVSVKQSEFNSSQIVGLTAYTEYCPIRLTQIYDMPLSQSLYLLKQSIIGFQRLYNRFGGFQILNSMISINERGYCRVWFNENFALNSFPKREVNQNKMVNKIITIIQSHSQDSKGTRKLFSYLKKCSTYLSSLKVIQSFVRQSKIFVPTRFVTSSTPVKQPFREPPILTRTFNNLEQVTAVTRFSVKQQKYSKLAQAIKEQLKNSSKGRKHSFSPLQIKRFKSQDTINGPQMLKISDGETDYTGKRNKTSNMQTFQTPGKYESDKKIGCQSYSPKKHPKWMEESSYVMEQYALNEETGKKHKKQMTHSLAFKQAQNMMSSEESLRKYSCKLNKQKRRRNMDSNYPYFSKKSVNQPYFAEFCDLLDRDDGGEGNRNQIPEQDEDKIRQDHNGQIYKNNGWVSNVSGLLNIQDKLQFSFDNGQEQNIVNKDVKLQKLGKLGRKQMTTSVLPQQMGCFK